MLGGGRPPYNGWWEVLWGGPFGPKRCSVAGAGSPEEAAGGLRRRRCPFPWRWGPCRPGQRGSFPLPSGDHGHLQTCIIHRTLLPSVERIGWGNDAVSLQQHQPHLTHESTLNFATRRRRQHVAERGQFAFYSPPIGGLNTLASHRTASFLFPPSTAFCILRRIVLVLVHNEGSFSV